MIHLVGLLNLFGKIEGNEERSLYSSDGSMLTITSLFGGSTVSAEQLNSIPTAKTSLDLIAGSIAQLPIYLYKEQNGEVVKVPNDHRVRLLNSEANYFSDSFQYKRKLVEDYVLYGKALTYVKRSGNTVIELHSLSAKDVQLKAFSKDRITLSDIQIFYSGYGGSVVLPYEDVLMIDSGSNGVLKNGDKVLQLALNEVDFSKSLLDNSALPTGVLQSPNKLSEAVVKRLRQGWQSLYAGGKNAGKTVILEDGIEYIPISLNPDQLQLTDSKKITSSEIAKLFSIPESMINSTLTKYSSNAAENLHFLQYTLAPIITAIESALDKSLLLESEKDNGYYFRFDTSEILRGTPKEQIEAISLALEKGIITINEARSALDKNKLQTNDFFLLSLGSVMMDATTGEITIPNMGLGENVGEKNEDGNSV